MIEQSVLVLIGIFGAVVGSFLNVVILRLPTEGESIVFPGSRCPLCKSSIRWYDNLPVLSYIILRGRCRQCRAKISWQYPFVEFCMGLLGVSLFLKFSLSVPFVIYFLFSAMLLAIIFIDFHHQIIPDVISLPGVVIGFGVSFVNPMVSWQSSCLGLLIGGGSLYVLALAYYLATKREGMGGGDIKLLAMIGAFLGWQSLPFVVFSSSLLGAVFGISAMIKQGKGGKTVIPYGPFLSGGAYLYLFFQEQIHHYFIEYMKLSAGGAPY
ncbi:prepilin peptidase [Thermodesulfobacteriota bacterium]